MDLEKGLSQFEMGSTSNPPTTEEAPQPTGPEGHLEIDKETAELVKEFDKIRVGAWDSLLCGLRTELDDTNYKNPYIWRKIDAFRDQERVVHIGWEEVDGRNGYYFGYSEDERYIFRNRLKWEIVTYLEMRCEFNWRSYLAEIKKNEVKLMSLYEFGDRNMDKRAFIEMLFLDGCFLLFAFMLLGSDHHLTRKIIETSKDAGQIEMAFATRRIPEIIRNAREIKVDLLMIHNQIPFLVIDMVPCENLKNFMGCSIETLVLRFFDDIYPPACKYRSEPRGETLHLLHIFHWSRTPPLKYKKDIQSDLAGEIPSASELQRSGISFCTKGSGTDLGITFSHGLWGAFKLRGIMNMPRLHIRGYTKFIWYHLMLFEQYRWQHRWQHCDDPGFYITSYLASMNLLVNSQKDVKLLRHSGILASISKTDEEVFEIIKGLNLNQLYRIMEPSLNIKLAYEACELHKQVRDHHEQKWNIRYGELKQSYCGNVWITFSVIAAILLFLFTGLQSAYAVASYHFLKK